MMSEINEKEILRRFELISKFTLNPEVTASNLDRVRKKIAEGAGEQKTSQQNIWRWHSHFFSLRASAGSDAPVGRYGNDLNNGSAANYHRKTIMKSRITKFAAAIVILLVIIFTVSHVNDSVDIATTAFAQIKDVITSMPWQHTITQSHYYKNGQQETYESESWYSFESKTMSIISKHDGKIKYYELPARKKHLYDPETNTLTISYLSSDIYNLVSHQLPSPANLLSDIIAKLKKWGAAIEMNKSQFEEKNVNVYFVTFPAEEYEETGMLYRTQKLIVDPDRNLLIASKTKQWGEDKIVTESLTHYTYPSDGPKDIYEMGVPETVKILDYIPPEKLHEVLDAISAYRDSFPDRYIAIVVRSHYLWSYDMYLTEAANTYYVDGNRQRIERRHFVSTMFREARKEIESKMQDDFAWQFSWWSQDTNTESGMLFTEITLFDGKQVYELRRRQDMKGQWTTKRKFRAMVSPFAGYGPVPLSWPKPAMDVKRMALIEDDYAKEKGLICIQTLSDGKMGRKKIIALPRKCLFYINPAKDFICEKAIYIDQRNAPWQSDASWLDGISPSKINKEDWTLIREVVAYRKTSSGRWLPKKIQNRQIRPKMSKEEIRRNKGRMYTIYFKENQPFPQDVFNPEQLPKPVIQKIAGIPDAKGVRELNLCKKRLRQIGNAIAMYQNDFNGKNPPSLDVLVQTEGLNADALACPSAISQKAEGAFVYRGKDLCAASSSDMIVAYEKAGNHPGGYRNVLLASFQVKRMTENEFKELVTQDNILRKKEGLPEKSIK